MLVADPPRRPSAKTARRTLPRATAAALALGLAAASCGPGQDRSGGAASASGPVSADARVEVTVPTGIATDALDGRLVVVFSHLDEGEPRFHVGDGPDGAPVFGIDVEEWAPGTPAVLADSVFGFPVERLGELPEGRYRVQAILNRYQTFRRADGHVVKLPPDRGEGQQWNRKPGNLTSSVAEVEVDDEGRMRVVSGDADGGGDDPLRLTLSDEIPPIADFAEQETEWIRYVKIRSDLLSDFWGTDMYLAAWVLLPAGFEEHPEARYPLAIFHGHFPSSFGGWRTEPPDYSEPCEYSARFDLDCYNHVQDSLAYELYRDWTSDDFPRHLVVEIQHPTPYYDDSYAVNSAAQGPYGDAIMTELIPEVERRFRGIGEGWARVTYGGSTGGWEAMAAQVFYPDDLNGAYIACPDPIDFRAYTLVDLYDDENAYLVDSPFNTVYRPGRRNYLGEVDRTLMDSNHLELVLGTRGRSGQQWDIWEATYSPLDDDGYPQRIWDKVTGEIDPEVAAYWRENYDLTHILRRDWATLGPKLEGKLHIYVGEMDNYYLNNAVYLAEEFLESTTDPYYGGEVAYGARDEHCWNGDPTRSNAYSRLRYVQMFAPRMVERIEANHPPGADLTSWRY